MMSKEDEILEHIDFESSVATMAKASIKSYEEKIESFKRILLEENKKIEAKKNKARSTVLKLLDLKLGNSHIIEIVKSKFESKK